MEQVEEKVILKNLVLNEEFFKKAFPFLEAPMFLEEPARKIFTYISQYAKKYGKRCSPDIIAVMESRDKDVSEKSHAEMQEIVAFFKDGEVTTYLEWLSKATENWIQRQIYYNALLEGATKFESTGETANAEVELSGASKCRISVTETLYYELSGASTLRVRSQGAKMSGEQSRGSKIDFER